MLREWPKKWQKDKKKKNAIQRTEEDKRKKKKNSLREMWDTTKLTSICVTGVPEVAGGGGEKEWEENQGNNG